MEKITAIIPIKLNSERVSGKNFRLFNGLSLYQIILKTLDSCEYIDEIIIDTDCPEMLEKNSNKVKLLERPELLLGDMVTMNTLLEHSLKFAKNEHIFQTHCTNPLLSKSTIDKSITQYIKNLDKHDSLFSVNEIKARTYDANLKPINHDFKIMMRTQDLAPVYEENSNFFLFSKSSFSKSNNRIGQNPDCFPMSKFESIDIDYEEDFLLAELVHKNQHLFIS